MIGGFAPIEGVHWRIFLDVHSGRRIKTVKSFPAKNLQFNVVPCFVLFVPTRADISDITQPTTERQVQAAKLLYFTSQASYNHLLNGIWYVGGRSKSKHFLKQRITIS